MLLVLNVNQGAFFPQYIQNTMSFLIPFCEVLPSPVHLWAVFFSLLCCFYPFYWLNLRPHVFLLPLKICLLFLIRVCLESNLMLWLVIQVEIISISGIITCLLMFNMFVKVLIMQFFFPKSTCLLHSIISFSTYLPLAM